MAATFTTPSRAEYEGLRNQIAAAPINLETRLTERAVRCLEMARALVDRNRQIAECVRRPSEKLQPGGPMPPESMPEHLVLLLEAIEGSLNSAIHYANSAQEAL